VSAAQFDGYTARAEISSVLKFGGGAGVDTTLSLKAGQRFYRADTPPFGFARQDNFFEAKATATKIDWAVRGFAPQLTVGYALNQSNLPFYDRSGLSGGIGLTRRF
jgi:hypothetical protein